MNLFNVIAMKKLVGLLHANGVDSTPCTSFDFVARTHDVEIKNTVSITLTFDFSCRTFFSFGHYDAFTEEIES